MINFTTSEILATVYDNMTSNRDTAIYTDAECSKIFCESTVIEGQTYMNDTPCAISLVNYGYGYDMCHGYADVVDFFFEVYNNDVDALVNAMSSYNLSTYTNKNDEATLAKISEELHKAEILVENGDYRDLRDYSHSFGTDLYSTLVDICSAMFLEEYSYEVLDEINNAVAAHFAE